MISYFGLVGWRTKSARSINAFGGNIDLIAERQYNAFGMQTLFLFLKIALIILFATNLKIIKHIKTTIIKKIYIIKLVFTLDPLAQ